MSEKKTFVKNNLYVFGNKIISKIVTLFLLIFFARYLTEYEYGQLSELLLLSSIFIIFQEAGTGFVIIRETSKNKVKFKQILFDILLIQILTGIISLILFIVTAKLLGYSQIVIKYSWIFASSMFIQSLFQTSTKAFEGLENVKISSGFQLAERIINIVFILLLFPLINSILLYGIVSLVTYILCLISIIYYIIKKTKGHFQFNRKSILDTINMSKVFLLFSIFSVIYNRIDLLWISYKLDEVAVASYRVVFQLVETVYIIPLNLGITILPFFSRKIKNNDSDIQHYYLTFYKFFLFFSIFIAIVIITSSSDILRILYNKYENSNIIFIVLSFSIPFYFLSFFNGNLLIALNKEKSVTKILITTTLFKLILNIVVFRTNDLYLISIIAVASEILSFILQQILVLKHKFTIKFNYDDLRKIIFLIIMTLLLFIYESIAIKIMLLVIFAIIIFYQQIQIIYKLINEKK